MSERRRSIGAALLGGVAGASAWVSWGTVAITTADQATRVGVVPALWSLPLLAALGAAGPYFSRVPLARAWPCVLTLLVWLPWLPFNVPTAFLMWEGPLEGLVWLAVAVGLVADEFGITEKRGQTPFSEKKGSDPFSPSVRRRDPALAFALAAVAYVAAGAYIQPRLPAGDEPHYLIITQSLLHDGDLKIQDNHDRGDYFAYYDRGLAPDFLRRGTDGQIYSIHAPGISALVLPAFAVFGYAGALVTVALLVAAGTALAWHAAWLLTGNRAAAWVGWAAVAFSAPVFFHGFTIFPDGAGAALTMVSVWVLVRLSTGEPQQQRLWLLAAAGAALSLLPWLHTRFALISAVLGLATAIRALQHADRARAMAAYLAVPVPAALAWFAQFYLIYGMFNPAAPYGGGTDTAVTNLQPGLPGILFDQQFGLFTSAPVLLTAIAGAALLLRRHPRLVLEVSLVAIPYLLAVASYRMWWGGYSAPARFLVAALLPAAMFIAIAWSSSVRALRAGIAVLLGLTVANTLVRVVIDRGQLLYNTRDGFDVALDWASRTVNLPLALPSLHRELVPDALLDIAVWCTALVIAACALALIGPRLKTRAAAITAASAIASAFAMAAASTVWAGADRPVRTPGTSQLELLHSWNPALEPTAVRLTPTRRIAAAEVPRLLALSSTTRGARAPGVQPLLQMPLVPAGTYDVFVEQKAPLSGTLRVMSGRVSQPLETWHLDGRPHGFTGLTLSLPQLVHSITITGDDAAHASVGKLTLHPRSVQPPAGRLDAAYALRASRYGPLRVFFLDDNAFMEPPGFWVRGEATTTVIVEPDAGAPRRLRLRNGPVANTATIAADSWAESRDLQPGESWEVDVPAGNPSGGTLVQVTSAAGFRPNDVDATSTDTRKLGVWVEVP